eukprot:GEMP01053388.1.p2 GENE.GEMP01053388.1~~GEMP01053388.1.p2  ORF type:complete len:123 (+),score=18.69 GEMP01053388.1:145-513(+)
MPAHTHLVRYTLVYSSMRTQNRPQSFCYSTTAPFQMLPSTVLAFALPRDKSYRKIQYLPRAPRDPAAHDADGRQPRHDCHILIDAKIARWAEQINAANDPRTVADARFREGPKRLKSSTALF